MTGPGVILAVTEPVANASLEHNRVVVRGTIQGPPNTGVSINGVPANVEGGLFVANEVPLVAGVNTLTATASVLAPSTRCLGADALRTTPDSPPDLFLRDRDGVWRIASL